MYLPCGRELDDCAPSLSSQYSCVTEVLAKLAFAAYMPQSLTRHYPVPTAGGRGQKGHISNAGHVSECPQ
jgi:hypothetical protein